MAKNTKKKKPAPQVAVSKKQYFETGRIRNLPLGKSYLNRRLTEEDDSMMAMVTRNHSNGNIAFALFMVLPTDMTADLAIYDFNVDPADLADLLERFDLEEYDDYAPIHHLITDSLQKMAEYHIAGDIELRYGKMILEPDTQTFPRDTLLWDFDNPASNTDKDEKTNTHKAGDFQSMTEEAQEKVLTYHPQAIVTWDRQQWKTYFQQINDLNIEQSVCKGVSPLLYFFEKCILPLDKKHREATSKHPLNEDALKAINKLLHHPPKLTEQPLEVVNNYIASQQEKDLLINFYYKVMMLETETEGQSLISQLRALTKKYPKNAQFWNLIYNCYRTLGLNSKAADTAKTMYKTFPRYIFGKLNYIEVLLEKEKYKQIPEVLEYKYSLETIYPERESFHVSEYGHFYRLLLDYFVDNNNHIEAWQLNTALVASPHYHNIHLKQTRLAQKHTMVKLATIAHFAIPQFLKHEEAQEGMFIALGV